VEIYGVVLAAVTVGETRLGGRQEEDGRMEDTLPVFLPSKPAGKGRDFA